MLLAQSLIAELVRGAGIVQRRLSNGMKINYCQTDNEPQAAMVRMVAAGGRAMEGQGPGPLGPGVVSIGTRTLSESGTVGGWRRDQVQLHLDRLSCPSMHQAFGVKALCVHLGQCTPRNS